ncbi:MAG TPA: glycosyltransferase family 2 protein [Pirellulales bacterium]|jgi:glycosyltransferase involved in cell wall biosynthesis|nr:glycosyltransferase family 2 protein [Pirellulales bacterium]
MNDWPRVDKLESVTVILPVMNETISLRETVKIILRDARDDIREFLIVVCKFTTPEAMQTIADLQKEHGALITLHHQKLPFLGGAIREAFELAQGSHLILMASDLETDPNIVRKMIDEERQMPSGIVTTSRWIAGGSFEGYSKLKLFCNWIFQRFFSLMYFTRLSDMTYAYRIMPTKLVQSIQWDELRHPFLFETLIKPLRLGVPVKEIPAVWKARIEGESQNTFFRNFVYFRTGLKTRFASKSRILRAAAEPS